MDTAERDDRVMTIAAEALKKPLGERESFLRAACQNDSDLYQEVSEVVTWEARMSTFLCRPLIDLVDIDSLDKPFEPQQKVAGRFDIIREIGDGGMGVVYEAYDNTREQRIAIKCAKPGFSRLQSPELNGALKVRHPNVCQLNDIHMVSTDLGDLRFITMELLDGETLLSRLSRGRLNLDEAMKFAQQLCDGLAEAHRSGVVHGDLKPANIILSVGKDNEIRAVITDFGLAVNQDADTGLLGGTPSYMAPELKAGGRVSTASDVYALGVILYEMVTGQKPFPAASKNKEDAAAPAVPHKIVKPIPPSKLVSGLPGKWDDAILPCLPPNPEQRPTVTQVLTVLHSTPPYLKFALAAMLLITLGALSWRPVYKFVRPIALHLKHLGADSISPDGAEAYRAGTNYLREGRYSFDQAIEQFQKASQQDVHSALPHAGLAEAYNSKYRVQKDPSVLDEAKDELQRAEQLDSDSPTVRLASAWLNITDGEKDAQAGEDCSRALEVDPQNAEAWMVCGFVYDLQGRDGEALKYYKKAIALDPNYFRPHQFLGGYYFTRGEFAEAEKEYTLEVQYAKDDLDGLSDLGGTLTALAKYEEAEKRYNQSLAIHKTPATLNNLGATWAFWGDDVKALSYYQQAKGMEPSNYYYWLNIGDAQRRLGNPKIAKAAYQQGLSLTKAHLRVNSKSSEARIFMAYAQARLGQAADASQNLGEALPSSSNAQLLLFQAILTSEVLGDRKQSLKLYGRLNPDMKKNAEHHPDLAELRKDLR
jgi:serine/threonine protein kinase/Flp pilus assembly protein TadD